MPYQVQPLHHHSFMLSRVARLVGYPSNMEIQIQLDKRNPFYTNEDEVAGHVVLRNDIEVDIATITISLAGQATSRLDSGKLTESHEVYSPTTALCSNRLIQSKQLFQRSLQIFPPGNCAGWFTSGTVTIPPGEHSFPFSIMVSGLPPYPRLNLVLKLSLP